MDTPRRLRVLHVEDDAAHAELIRRALAESELPCDVRLAISRRDFMDALKQAPPDLILSDSHAYDIEGLEALRIARRRFPGVPFLFVSASFSDKDPGALKAAGADACLLKSDLGALTGAIRLIFNERHGGAAFQLDFKRLFEQSPDVLLVLLPDAPRFTIVGATRARYEATHSGPEQVGQGLFEMFPDNPDDPTATGTSNLRASLMRVIETRAADSMAVQKYDIRGEDGSFLSKYWSPKNIPVLSDQGDVSYILHRVEDVTELVRMTEAGEELRGRSREMEQEVVRRSQELAQANSGLREANARLGELDAAKTVFFSNISHEFRTPLTLLLGPLEDLLHDSAVPAAARLRAELAMRNALRLQKLVNALLDFSRLEAGRMRASYAPTDIGQATRELVGMFQSAADDAGLALRTHIPAMGEPAYVDQDMWEKIVLNLLSNAFKFTLKGHVEVQLHERADSFELVVQDTGIGIPEDQLPRVFERFYRVSESGVRSQEGSGIGLSMLQELVKLHGGQVRVQSRHGVGTTFTVSIPKGSLHLPPAYLVQASERGSKREAQAYAEEAQRWVAPLPAPAEAPAPDSKAARRPRVLVADDNADLRLYITRLLEPHYRVEAVTDGRQALERARAERPELVLSDVMMPNLDGFGLLRELRDDALTRDLPVILLSARAGDEAATDGLDAGADDYLTKPFSARELLGRVRTHLELARSRRKWGRELERINRELETFSWTVSHDLRGPLRSIDGFARYLEMDYGDKLDADGRRYIQHINTGVKRMSELIEDLLRLARVSRGTLQREAVDVSDIARQVAAELQRRDPARQVAFEIEPGLTAQADARLVHIVLENLMGNAWKFTSKREAAHIRVGVEQRDGIPEFHVQDDGDGFDAALTEKLFTPFQRLHSNREFEGTGIGLATVQRIIQRHQGRIRAEGEKGRGASFHFTLQEEP